jgi:hypothetical protein
MPFRLARVGELADFGAAILAVAAAFGPAVVSNRITNPVPLPAPALSA